MRRLAFSLLELLVVLTILALLMALLFPVLVMARDKAYRGSCAAHLRQLGHAFAMYESDHDSGYPVGPIRAGIDGPFTSSLSPYAPESVHVCSLGPYDFLYRTFFVTDAEYPAELWKSLGVPPPEASRSPDPSLVLAVCDAHFLEGFTVKGHREWITMTPAGRRGRQLVLRADGSVDDIDAHSVRTMVAGARDGHPVWETYGWRDSLPMGRQWMDLYPGEAPPLRRSDGPGGRPVKQRAFSLLELLVVVTILALLAALLFPVVAQARARAGMASCTSNLRGLGTAVHLYEGDHDGRLPLASLSHHWDDYGGVPTPEGANEALTTYGVVAGAEGAGKCPLGRFEYDARFVFTLRDELGTDRVHAVRQVEPAETTVLADCVHHLAGGYSRSGDGYSFRVDPRDRSGTELALRGDGSVFAFDTKRRRTFQVGFAGGKEAWTEITPYRGWSSQEFPNTDRVDVFPGEAWPPRWTDLWSRP